MLKLDKPLILASSSLSRKSLLERLQMPFTVISPDIDETGLPAESPAEKAQRLSLEKAQAVAKQAKHHYIIASDQVAVCEDQVLHKPLNADKAIKQLQFQSGKNTTFYTGLCLFDSDRQHYQLGMESYQVTFRKLLKPEIEAYVATDQPFNCAGSFKSESMGITLFEKLYGNDPNALIGLPLILLTTFLKNVQLA